MACLQKEWGLRWEGMAVVKSSVTVLHKELEVVMDKVSELELENATLRKEIKTSSKTCVEGKGRLAKDHGKTRDDFEKERKECDALRAKVGKLEEELQSQRKAPKVSEVETEELES